MHHIPTLFCAIFFAQFDLGRSICGERSSFLRGAEDVCWTKKVEVVDRVQYSAKSVLNFAKKTLGIGREEEQEPQKCNYYYCILDELKLVNSNHYPCPEKIGKWIKNNVIYVHAEILLERMNQCFEGYYNSTETSGFFYGDKIESNQSIDSIPTMPQTECDIALEFMKCLSLAEKECVTFQYP